MQVTTCFLCILAIVVIVVRAVHVQRLASIPGPFLARVSDIWRWRAQNSNSYSANMVEIHEKYGKLVRIGPNHISISDPNAVPIVYTTNPVWPKVSTCVNVDTKLQTHQLRPHLITLPRL